MRVQKLILLIAAGAAVVMLATTPGVAETKPPKSYPIDPVTGYPVPRAVNRSPAKVTVSRRSYLDPGKESKPPNMSWSSFPADSPSGIFYDPTDWRVNYHNRTPFPNCLDLPGFCR
jgi:hypothetical protein